MARKVAPVNAPKRPGKPGGLGAKIEATIERIVAWVYSNLIDPVSDRIRNGIDTFLEEPRNYLREAARPILTDIQGVEGLPPNIKSFLAKVTGTEPITLTLVLVGLAMGVVGGLVSGLMQPISRVVAQWLDAGIESARADPGTAYPLGWRTPGLRPKLKQHMQQLGWDEPIIAAFEDVLRPRLSPGELWAAAVRLETQFSRVEDELEKRGYDPEDIRLQRSLRRLIPGPPDLVSMAVREAFDPAIISKYGYAQDFPAEFGQWMKKQGDEDGWAEKYWAAHWRMPGLNSALEAFYRLEDFGETELAEFLRVADIAPKWREYITRTAYRTLTRVDIRRMHDVGVLSDSDVYKSYRDFGYSELDARRMAEFTVALNTEKERDLTKADVLGGLDTRMLSGIEAVEWLEEIGYSNAQATYLVSRRIAQIERKQADRRIKYLRNLYVHGELTPPQVSTHLSALGLSASEISGKLDEWDIDREGKTERPSRATLEKFFRRDVITAQEFEDGLDKLGYVGKYVEWYLANAMEEKTAAARKEEERARGEQENIRKRRIKSEYQITKAAMDVDTAEVQTAIAEMQQALRERRLRYQREIDVARQVLTRTEIEDLAQRDIAALGIQVKEVDTAIAFLDTQVEQVQTEIADIKLRALPEVAEISPEVAARRVKELQLRIEQIQDESAAAGVAKAQLQRDAHARRLQLREDLDIVALARSAQEIEVEYQAALEELQVILSQLRVNLAELREQKARVKVGYRVGLAEEG